MDVAGHSDHPFLGDEFDWLAVDSTGAIGFFSTAGCGWIPESVLTNAESFRDTLKIVSKLPRLGEPEYRSNLPVAESKDWLAVAARGIFAFDWNPYTDQYELVASPHVLLGSSDAVEIAALAAQTVFASRFALDIPPYLEPKKIGGGSES
jgi:hypothetical protein